MGGLFSKPKAPKIEKIEPPPPPKSVRMPVETDPEVTAATQRNRQAAMRRQGRLSTILTDRTRATTGSSGQKLGA